MIPVIMMANLGAATNVQLARAGAYVMSTLMLIICVVLAVRGLKLRQHLLSGFNNNNNNRQHQHESCALIPDLPTRILIGALTLTISMTSQALFWALSVTPDVLDGIDPTDNIELGFGIPAFITYCALLFLFFAGVEEAAAKAAASSSQKSSSGIASSHSNEDLSEHAVPRRVSRAPSRELARLSQKTALYHNSPSCELGMSCSVETVCELEAQNIEMQKSSECEIVAYV